MNEDTKTTEQVTSEELFQRRQETRHRLESDVRRWLECARLAQAKIDTMSASSCGACKHFEPDPRKVWASSRMPCAFGCDASGPNDACGHFFEPKDEP